MFVIRRLIKENAVVVIGTQTLKASDSWSASNSPTGLVQK